MKLDGQFPYPHIVEALDGYYKGSGRKEKKDKKEKKEKKEKKKKEKEKSTSEVHVEKPEAPRTMSNRRLSILITTFWDYPHTGGLSNYIKTLSEGLRRMGHRVDVVAPNQFPAREVNWLRDECVPSLRSFFSERYGSYNSKILRNQRYLYVYEQMLRKYINLRKYDVFHAQDLFTANILGRLNEEYKKPLFFTNHGMFTFNRVKFDIFKKDSLEEAYYKSIEQKAISYANHLVILSDVFRTPLMQLGAKDADMTTVLTGIEYGMPSYRTSKEQSKKFVIVCVARLGPRKGHNLLLDAITQLPKSMRDNLEVLIVGDGEMREALEKQKRSLGLSMVEFLGTRDDVPYLLSKADVFVLPTLNDSLPVSIIEAMHSGVCVISTSVGGIPELVKHGKTGILIDSGDAKKLAGALKFTMTNHEAREKLADNGKKFARTHLTREAMISHVTAIYQRYVR
ncbi:glycosyltransferase family 4 protein [Priestia taiwanensis]|uniref:Uncharacterized protein n=1 Tax=Priestia taiwanensis TaxID=1347902 RepID=A0A917EQL2_9BACI|nr:glycosyltransferase family 4 protein [Priestia taiwanensis]MBM7364157.1 glycosyltransferase involved in cell wall biosynthesis [Priestia taiwanensis]GGE72084.1 hypothetical protein GCM10007140_22530 [Priestia taiwanensis]